MKKYLSLLLGSLIVLLMFVTPGNSAKAAEPELLTAVSATHDCGCDVSPVLGAERNKLVSNLLSSDEYKTVKSDTKNAGYKSHGANEIEVIRNNANGMILIAVPFTKGNVTEMFVFANGVFVGTSQM
jgi:hypothetical protein